MSPGIFFLGNYLKKPNFRWSFETDSGKTTWFDQLWALTTIARWEVPEQCPQSHWPSVFVELCLGCKGSPLRIPHPQIETFEQKLDHFNYKDQRQLLGLAKSIYLQLRENWDRFHSRVWVRWNSCFWISFWENKLFWASHKLYCCMGYGLVSCCWKSAKFWTKAHLEHLGPQTRVFLGERASRTWELCGGLRRGTLSTTPVAGLASRVCCNWSQL